LKNKVDKRKGKKDMMEEMKKMGKVNGKCIEMKEEMAG